MVSGVDQDGAGHAVQHTLFQALRLVGRVGMVTDTDGVAIGDGRVEEEGLGQQAEHLAGVLLVVGVGGLLAPEGFGVGGLFGEAGFFIGQAVAAERLAVFGDEVFEFAPVGLGDLFGPGVAIGAVGFLDREIHVAATMIGGVLLILDEGVYGGLGGNGRR